MYDSVMDIIITANEKEMKGDANMCEALERIMADKLEEYKEDGKRALTETCNELGLSKEDTIKKLMEKFQLDEKKAWESIEKYWK